MNQRVTATTHSKWTLFVQVKSSEHSPWTYDIANCIITEPQIVYLLTRVPICVPAGTHREAAAVVVQMCV